MHALLDPRSYEGKTHDVTRPHKAGSLKIWETIVTLKCYLTPRFPSLASQSAQFEHSSRDSVDLKRCPGDSETPGRLRTTHLTGPHELSEPEWPLQ